MNSPLVLERTVLTLVGEAPPDGGVTAGEVLDAAHALLSDCGLTSFEVQFPTSRGKMGQMLALDRARKDRRAKLPRQTVSDFGVYAPSGLQLRPEWYAQAYVTVSQNVSVIVVNDRCADANTWLRLGSLNRLIALLTPQYGYVLRPRDPRDPLFDAMGLGGLPAFWPTSDMEIEDSNRWANEALNDGAHLRGRIRDVYPINLLNASHLNMPTPTGTFADRLRAAPDLGSLEPGPGGLWWWRVPEDRIVAARALTRQAGMLSRQRPDDQP
ncbi:MAG: hypothetical protein KIT68_12085 [Phycisphaeraceae bacterium]|nr:hypothetical protein [Phycisphaeraceae bacterium]